MRLLTSASVAGESTLSSDWPTGSMPRERIAICAVGVGHLRQVDFFDQEVGVLERRIERRV